MFGRMLKGAIYGAVVFGGAWLFSIGWEPSLMLGAIPVVCGMLNIFVSASIRWSAAFGIVAVIWWALPLQKIAEAVLGKEATAKLPEWRDDIEIKLGLIPPKPPSPPAKPPEPPSDPGKP